MNVTTFAVTVELSAQMAPPVTLALLLLKTLLTRTRSSTLVTAMAPPHLSACRSKGQ